MVSLSLPPKYTQASRAPGSEQEYEPWLMFKPKEEFRQRLIIEVQPYNGHAGRDKGRLRQQRYIRESPLILSIYTIKIQALVLRRICFELVDESDSTFWVREVSRDWPHKGHLYFNQLHITFKTLFSWTTFSSEKAERMAFSRSGKQLVSLKIEGNNFNEVISIIIIIW